MYVLFVEDEPAMRRAIERWLELGGHTMCWAESARGAMELLRTELDLDAIILDMLLADGSDGWAVLRARIADPRLRQIPVIILSAVDAEEIRRRAAPGADMLEGTRIILDKPPDLGLLKKALELIEGSKHSRGAP